ncbi:glycerophosphodiester phosphodiesterase [Staphylococcus massiliensis]|uniref:Glycerophosphoryl diester phosphodiesterase n=1 Tax=Staphylococcus massiliensis S46 TaxID=1229783 RepID=K9AZR6_9STAP|nr:glycerophosphodiester phosphodiesterase [Staphylococcus massiliensis]EKU48057.1 glycerophosphoryl diester phosphodiesterase [Staphylococcus massiliensis S46]MCG3400005.1 glycerophosphodiester phosphodiesterase [Staphylococcus massiliensis]MCG3401632.1 glycerophosphodiester phosphodiesterase [Staphylococcus massiliensis]MCG3412166.1 glycerophosphodiester phosphodiesterase [Staphylococcus massiliensis]POA01200.1 glycerophosphodiester phosphodiesterase [Staphylococcus massiliensis CCUG 55927]
MNLVQPRFRRVLVSSLLFIPLTIQLSGTTSADDTTDVTLDQNTSDNVTVGHRGASAYAPENTLEAYDKSFYEQNSDYIEMDLQLTRDGELVSIHDTTLGRTTNGNGLVGGYTLEELKQLDAGSWFNQAHPDQARPEYQNAKIPTFDEILSRYGKDAHYYVEIKSPELYPGIEEKILEKLKQHGMLNQTSFDNKNVIIQSFSKSSMKKMNQLNPNIPVVQLLPAGRLSMMSDAELNSIDQYADGINPNYKDINPQTVERLHNLDMPVHPYTVNNPEDMKYLNQSGVDGAITNKPDVYNQVSGK